MKNILKKSAYGKNFPNITNNLDNIDIKCSLLSDSVISGKRSNVLDSFATSTKTRFLPFEIQRTNFWWNKIDTKYISEVKFYMVDDEDKEVDLNGIDVSITVVMKKV